MSCHLALMIDINNNSATIENAEIIECMTLT